MKKTLIYSVFLLCGAMACSQEKGKFSDENERNPKTLPADSLNDSTAVIDGSTASFGSEIRRAGAIPAHTLPVLMEKQDSMELKLQGEIVEVCQKKGCWMTVDLKDGNLMRVTFKDYGFFVPKDVHGKQAVIKGTAKKEITSVDDLRHFAEDGGKSKEEIEAIVAPEENLVFVAEGVILY